MTGESGVSTYNEESFAVTGPVGMKLIPELEPPFVVSEASPDSSTEDVSESQLRFRFKVRLADAPAVNRRGTILFRVEGVSLETSFSVPYLVVP